MMPRLRSTPLAAVAAAFLAACGGDPLPAPGPEPGGVSVEAVEPAGFDEAAVIWLTREPEVTVRGRAPASSVVEALRPDTGALRGVRADGAGAFALDLPAADGTVTYQLRARAEGDTPGPATPLRLQRRVTPPALQVDPPGGATKDGSVDVGGTTEPGLTVVVQVGGGAQPVNTRTHDGRFRLAVPLHRDQVNTLAVTASDLAGNQAGPVAVTVVQDSTAPPAPQFASSLAAAPRVLLRGAAPEAVRVVLDTPANGRLELAVQNGEFAAEVDLPAEGANAFGAVAVDAAGNQSERAERVVVRDTTPPAPPVDVAVEGALGVVDGVVVVGSLRIALVGHAEPAATVEASGEGLFGAGGAAPGDGAFRVEVSLPFVAIFRPVEVRVEVVDAAGHRSAPATLFVRWGGG
jgi:hypothetical protein